MITYASMMSQTMCTWRGFVKSKLYINSSNKLSSYRYIHEVIDYLLMEYTTNIIYCRKC